MKKPPVSPLSALAGATAAPARNPSPESLNSPSKARRNLIDAPPARTRNSDLGDNDGQLATEQILRVLTALKKGDFSVRLPVTLTGTAGRVADAFNDVAEMLSSTTEDLSRVCRVV